MVAIQLEPFEAIFPVGLRLLRRDALLLDVFAGVHPIRIHSQVRVDLNLIAGIFAGFSTYTGLTYTFSWSVERMSENADGISQFDIAQHEYDKLVGEVIRYVLFKTEQNAGCPVKREELTQLITAKGYRQRNLPASVINEAKSKLSSIFGYEMREIQRLRAAGPGRASQPQQSTVDAKSYIIISQLPGDVYRKFVEDKSCGHVTGFTFVVIGIIHLSGGKVTEENLWHHLKRLGLHENEEHHPDFGNMKVALEALVQQRYLQKEKVNGPEGSTVHFELAERALDGAVYDRIKEYVTQIVQKDVTSAVGD